MFTFTRGACNHYLIWKKKSTYSDVSVLVNDTLGPFLEVVRGCVVPPGAEVSNGVELSSLVVEAVGDLVSDDCSNGAVVQSLGIFFVEEWRLEDGRWED